MFVDELTRWVLQKVSELDASLSVHDYCVGLKYSYVEVSGRKGRALGLALTPIEDVFGTRVDASTPPTLSSVESLVSSTNPIEKALGVALVNALSGYLMRNLGVSGGFELRSGEIVSSVPELVEDPVVVVGNMVPLVRRLLDRGYEVIGVLERRQSLRVAGALPDTMAPRVIPKARTVVITGATLVNDTIDYILSLAGSAIKILVGPTAAGHPTPLFRLGVSAVASMTPVEVDKVKRVVRLGGGRWSFSRYSKEYVAVPLGKPP